MMKQILLMTLLISMMACSSTETRLEKKRMKNNYSTEKIYRHSREIAYNEEPAVLVAKEPYPWESDTAFPKITINSLRCRGSSDRPVLKNLDKTFEDCNGMHDHGLPYVDGDEFVYPTLIMILNKVQKAFEKKVVVTSGHRCPKHHTYMNLGTSKISKYMIGARVDFYVEGMEEDTGAVIETIKELYKDQDEKYSFFHRNAQSDGTVAWNNKEIRLSVNREGEHSILQGKKHPVVTIDVRYDRERKKAIRLEWNAAYSGYIRN